ncbi:RloB family protein [Kribbella sp. CCNWLW197]|uniref:RloB family protein n=1 Tax=unclassified Kribbella TaxID=2644121 RepID=UPI003FCE606C
MNSGRRGRRKNLAPIRDLSRGEAGREQGVRHLVVCEGERTEKAYFKSYIRIKLKDTLLDIDVQHSSGDPLEYVRAAIRGKAIAQRAAKRERDDNLKCDQVWCVTDVDTHRNLPEARVLARRNEIRLVVTNPCFELWGILHLAGCTGHLSSADAAEKLREYMPKYDPKKNKEFQHELMEGKYAIARSRALALGIKHEGDGSPVGSNPSTDVYLLVDELIAGARRVRDAGQDGYFGL